MCDYSAFSTVHCDNKSSLLFSQFSQSSINQLMRIPLYSNLSLSDHKYPNTRSRYTYVTINPEKVKIDYQVSITIGLINTSVSSLFGIGGIWYVNKLMVNSRVNKISELAINRS